jgi:hypothetical protein
MRQVKLMKITLHKNLSVDHSPVLIINFYAAGKMVTIQEIDCDEIAEGIWIDAGRPCIDPVDGGNNNRSSPLGRSLFIIDKGKVLGSVTLNTS